MSRGMRPVPVFRSLRDVLAEAGVEPTGGLDDVSADVSGITHDSRDVHVGDLYAALPGFVTHGARYASDAVHAGAAAVLTDPVGAGDCQSLPVPVVVVTDPRAVLGDVASGVYGHPSRDLMLIGITGTNGKTTTCQMVASGLAAAGHRVGVIGTAGIRIGDRSTPATRTTPEATDLHALLAVMRDEGISAVAMEVSSHALVLGRVGGVVFDVVCFTNLTQDHLDFHRTMEDYFGAKSMLFDPSRARRAVIGTDDGYGRRLAQTCDLPKVTYALDQPDSDWSADIVQMTGDGQTLCVRDPSGAETVVRIGLPGRFNAENALAACAILAAIDVPTAAMCAGLAEVRVPGRMEVVATVRGTTYLVDYAHSPDAVRRVLESVRSSSLGKVICVIGCGGDRDREKRPLMGQIAASMCDVVVVTDDNPRSEDPQLIRAQILVGVEDVRAGDRAQIMEIGDRREAIRAAVGRAAPGDTVIILGKGHEVGQDVAGVVHPFDDREELSLAVREVAA